VRVWRAAPGGGRAVLLDGIDWTVREGDRWALVGPNGAGKTTLLRIAGAVAHPSEGTAAVLGERLGGADVRDLRARIGHVDARMAEPFAPRLTALQVALTGAAGTIVAARGRPGGEGERRRARDLLEEMGCGPLAGRAFGLLSAGERQRVLLARALMPRPRLLLLDEPTAGLDLPGREAFLARLDALAGSEPALTTVQVSHHLEELAASTTHALLLRGGRAVAAGPAEAVLTAANLSRCFGVPLAVARAGGRLLATVRPAGGSH